MSDKELSMIYGGAPSASFINSIVRAITTIYDIGKTVGSSVRRLVTGNICK